MRLRPFLFVALPFLLFLSFFLNSSIAVSQTVSGCPTTRLRLSEMTESGLRQWITQNSSSLQNLDDLVCCLPAELQKNAVIGHSSIAAQNGIPLSPRVVLFAGDAPQFVAATVNAGDHPALNQERSLELALLNIENEQLEYFDLENRHRGSFHLSEKNPAACLSCHNSGEQTFRVGARPLFDSFGRWNRFVGGRNPFCSTLEKSYYHKIDQAALSAVREKARFRCLDTQNIQVIDSENLLAPTSTEMFRRLTSLDTKLNQINAKRVSKLLQLDPNFVRYRNSFLGLNLCGGKLEEWLPAEVIQKIRSEKFLSKAFREAKTDQQWQAVLSARVQKETDLQQKTLKNMELQMSSNTVPFDKALQPAPLNELRCESHRVDVLSRLIKGSYSLSQSDLKITWSPELRQVFRKFQAHASFQGLKGDLPLMMILMALDSPLDLWQMSATGDGTMNSIKPLAAALKNEYQKNGRWAEELSKYFKIETDLDKAVAGPSSTWVDLVQQASKNPQACKNFKNEIQVSWIREPSSERRKKK